MKGSILHVHSTFSMHDSIQLPEEIVAKAKELGAESVTLTDHGTLLGIPEFMDAGKKYQINTVPGCEFYFGTQRDHLLVVAKDYQGYQAIFMALRDSWKHQVKVGVRWYPILMEKELEKYFLGNDHVLATTACIGGSVSKILLRNVTKRKHLEQRVQKVEVFKEAYDTWQELSVEYHQYLQNLDQLKKEKKIYAPYLTKAYAQSLQKLQSEEEQITFDADMQINTKVDTVKQMAKMIKHAEEMTVSIEEDIKSISSKQRAVKKTMDTLKNKKNRYQESIKSLENAVYEPEESLYQEAKAMLLKLSSIFPYFYVELQNHGIEEETYVMPILARLAAEVDLPVIASNDAHMPDNTDRSIRGRQVMRFNYFKKAEAVTIADRELYLKGADQLMEALSCVVEKEIAEQAVRNTRVLDQCKVIFPQKSHYPKVENGEEEFDRLLQEAKQKEIASGNWDDTHEERLQYEIAIIKKMGYVDYHLIVRDFCNMARTLGCVPKTQIDQIPVDFSKVGEWIKQKGYRVGIGAGPGRGSAVGSEVCYLLGITSIDPLKYDLLFERFLNPERVSMPDIDTDIKTSLRDTIIRYLKWKYGEAAVSSIVTEGMYASKSALQMAARNLASEIYDQDVTISKKERDHKKSTFSKIGIRLSQLVADDRSLESYETILLNACKNTQEEQIVKDAQLIEHRLYGIGIHAGGIIISDNKDVGEYIPLHWSEEKKAWVTQCDMNRAEQHGLLKMDLLGLKTLDLISDCLHLIKKHHGVDVFLSDMKEELAVFKAIYEAGYTNSVFQFESDGMKQMLRKFKPTTIEDLILLNACYRPGPMQYLQNIIDVKHKGKRVESCLTKIPELYPILESTYGYPVYQEQIMQIFQVLAGYSLGAADMVRRAMSKKKMDKLEIERRAFLYGDESRKIKGCKDNGIDTLLANELFDQMMDFAKYGFNKSHATAYAVLSYQTAWLKYHYPAEFICAMFENEDQENYDKVMEDVEEFGITVLPPAINRSFFEFTLEDGQIRFGFGGIKGIADRTVVQRFQVGNSHKVVPYQSLNDFLVRTRTEDGTFLDKRIMEALIKSGCFDEFIPNREKAYQMYEMAAVSKYETSELLREKLEKEELFLRSSTTKDEGYNLDQEVHYLGASVSFDPLGDYPEDRACGCIPMNELEDGKGLVYGFVTNVKLTTTKADKKMMILSLRGKHGKLSAFFLGKSYEKYAGQTQRWTNAVVQIRGSVNAQERIFFAENMTYMTKGTGRYFLRIDREEKAKQYLKAVEDHKDEAAICELIMDISVGNLGNKDGAYVPICPRLVTVKVSESVIKKTGAMQYRL